VPESRGKLRLSDNHRRVLSVLLRGVEQGCEQIAGWMAKQPGVLMQVEDDLSSEQRRKLEALHEKLRRELQRIEQEIELQTSTESPRRSIRALASAMTVDLEDRKSPRLDGYGPLPADVKTRLDAELNRLIALLEAMVEVLK
jgi:predicted phage gp36 major capsid-like protein